MLPISLWKPLDPTPRHRCPPCTPPTSQPTHQRGLSRLEFALAVAVGGVVLTLALDRLAQLQSLGLAARDQTVAAQQRSASALAQARCGLARTPIPNADLAAAPHTDRQPFPCPPPEPTLRTPP